MQNTTRNAAVAGQANHRARTPDTSDMLHSQVIIDNMPMEIRAPSALKAAAGVVAEAIATNAPLSAARKRQSTLKTASKVSFRDHDQRIRW